MTLYQELRPLQKGAVEFCVSQENSALWFQQRLGKTWVTLGVIEKTKPRRVLLVVPLANKETTWAALIREKLPRYNLLTFGKIKRKALLADLREFDEGILLIHFEQMCAVIKQLRKRHWDLIVIDESQRIKDKGSRASRAAAKLENASRKILLSGTPIEDQPSDMWAQFRFLAPEVFGTRWADFDAEYMEQPATNPDDYKPGSMRWRRAMMRYTIEKRKCKFREEKLPKFLKLIAPYCWRESLPSPEPKFHRELVELTGEQRRVYDVLKKHRVVKLNPWTKITAPMKMVLNEKLRQICGGYIKDEDGDVHQVGDAKMNRLRVILEDRGTPAVIFCQYTAEIVAIKRYLERKGRVKVISGKTDRVLRASYQRQFQAGKIDYLICQQRTGGVGIDLYRALYLVVYSCNFSSIDFSQMIARIRMPNQIKPVDIILILVRKSVDTDKLNVLKNKLSRTEITLSKLKRRNRHGRQ